MHVPSAQDVRSWRGLIERYRRSLVDRSVGVKNQSACVTTEPGESRGLPEEDVGRAPGLAWLAEVKWPTALEELRLEILLGRVEGVEAEGGSRDGRRSDEIDAQASGSGGC